MPIAFRLDVILASEEEDEEKQGHPAVDYRNELMRCFAQKPSSSSNDNDDSLAEAVFVSLAQSICLSPDDRPATSNPPVQEPYHVSAESPRFALVFVPPALVQAALDHANENRVFHAHHPSSSDHSKRRTCGTFLTMDAVHRQRLSHVLLSMIHPFLAHNFSIQSIFTTRRGLFTISHAAQSHQQSQQHSLSLPPQRRHNPSEVILLDLSHTPLAAVAELIQSNNCQTIRSGPEAILKIVLISQVRVLLPGERVAAVSSPFRSDAALLTGTQSTLASQQPTSMSSSSSSLRTLSIELQQQQLQQPLPGQMPCDMPTCPVCLHRIDPIRLGLAKPPTLDLCSKFCPTPNLSSSTTIMMMMSRHEDVPCPRQRLLRPWPLPSFCATCHVIDMYWQCCSTVVSGGLLDDANDTISSGLYCHDCSLQETLWVCLTCGFVGCGRYSNKHAARHYIDTGHPFCLELSTGRIWHYPTSEFAHRADLLECPCSPPIMMHPWLLRRSTTVPLYSSSSSSSSSSVLILDGRTRDLSSNHEFVTSWRSNHDHESPATSNNNNNNSGIHQYHGLGYAATNNEKSPMKASMIGEEYEALLQSALEDQAQHYEGEISRLRAELTAQQVDQGSMTVEESNEIDTLRLEITHLRQQIDTVSKDLLHWQAQEAGYRATSQHLLREQQVSQDLIKKIQQETEQEHEHGQQQIEELQQQIADLTANQRMRHQFTHNEELHHAQIVGTNPTAMAATTTTAAAAGANNRTSSSATKKGKKQRRFFRK